MVRREGRARTQADAANPAPGKGTGKMLSPEGCSCVTGTPTPALRPPDRAGQSFPQTSRRPWHPKPSCLFCVPTHNVPGFVSIHERVLPPTPLSEPGALQRVCAPLVWAPQELPVLYGGVVKGVLGANTQRV